jgi:hypothetical protein
LLVVTASTDGIIQLFLLSFPMVTLLRYGNTPHPVICFFDIIEEEEEIYICSSRLGLIKMDHHHSGNGRNSQQ